MEEKIKAILAQFPSWERKGKFLYKTFVFSSFEEAVKAMHELVPFIDKLNHHPEWENVYNKVRVKLTTHDQNELTVKDIDLLVLIENHWTKS